ncbi:TIGR03085 family metal-binding protein [Blastococcus sp. TF02A-26]|uniref:TIGR03085 family metal-binding protein n=1 Tax=Blastococcus sp. TF02A-26 TaxID=2250577 RepID=UPI001F300292|nr:TIGR03085 family metal-binding protein [Blastococcus sp. TF02A-26]
MTSSPASLAARERAALADLLETLGPDAPTCCEGWTTGHLAAHLVVRDHRPDAGPGYALETLPIGRGLHAHSARLEERMRTSTPFAEVVDRVRAGAPRWSPMGWPVVGDLVNAGEFAIHHEDVRRAQPEWEPRELSRADRDQLWRTATLFARRVGGATLRRTDVPGVEKRVGRGGPTLEGEPMELLLWTSGRRGVARVEVS